jgi:hypothetical protein
VGSGGEALGIDYHRPVEHHEHLTTTFFSALRMRWASKGRAGRGGGLRSGD